MTKGTSVAEPLEVEKSAANGKKKLYGKKRRSRKKATTKKTKIIYGLISAVVLIVTALVIVFVGNSLGSQSENGVEIQYTVSQVSNRETLEVSGTVEAGDIWTISFPVSGQVSEVFVQEKDSVEKNEALIKLNSLSEEYSLLATQQSLENAQLENNQQDIKLYQAEELLRKYELSLLTLKSNVSGQISSLEVQEGEWIAADQELGEIVDLSRLVASVEVDEMDVSLIEQGQTVVVQFDAYPDMEVDGVVSNVPIVARDTGQGIAVIDVEITIDDPPAEIFSGFNFIAEIIIGETKDILLVEKEAIMNDGDMTMAFVLGDDGPSPQAIEVKTFDDTYFQIVSGLKEGDVLLSPPSSDSDDEDDRSGFGFGLPGGGMGGRPPGGGGLSSGQRGN